MFELTEGELRFTFPGAVAAQRFDGDDHGLSHCMSAVDFIVEYPDRSLFIEVKDPDNTRARPDARARFRRDLNSEKLTHALVCKYRDSLLYRWAMGAADKPVRYAILLQVTGLSPMELMALSDRLKRQLPLSGPSRWSRSIAAAVMVLDIAQWNSSGSLGHVERVRG